MNIGFYLLNITSNNPYQTQILDMITQLCKLRPLDNIVLFNNESDIIHSNYDYYILHINEAKYFRGILFVFDANALLLTQTFPGPNKQIFITNTPQWTTNHQIPYAVWKNIYLNENIDIITINQELYNIINMCWKSPLSYLEQLNGEEINNVIQKL